ncbi:magnesium-dependent phosphatase-1 [Phlegmacium glaucopus]|nr:magnesium-dependent phosphatase-1 [Phlegmacium glaucopus]
MVVQNLTSHPQLVAFDLDYTLWDLWIDTHITGPLRRHEENVNEVLDKYGKTISFYEDVSTILQNLRLRSRSPVVDSNSKDIEDQNIIIAACSRTDTPNLARECLRLLLVPTSVEESPPRPAIDLFDELEIYPGSKIKHFKALHARTGIPYSQMLFFDDERRNAEVETLGVTFQEVPDGLTHRVFQEGLRKWRLRQLEN